MKDQVKSREELLVELEHANQRLEKFDHIEAALEQSKKELSDIKSWYQLVTENANDIIWLWDLRKQQFVYVSPSVNRIRNFTVEEVKKQSLYESVSPDDYWLIDTELPERVNALESGDESARIRSYEFYLTHKDGSFLPAEVSTTLILDKTGKASHLQGITRDITERKAALLIQKKTEQQIRAIIEACSESIFLIDRTGSIIFANQTTASRLGIKEENLYNKNIAELVAAETMEKRKEHVRDAILSGKPHRFEDKRGDCYLVNSLYPITDTTGHATHLAIYSMDITERKKTELSLRESEERYRNLFEKNTAVMLLIDKNSGAIVDANIAACAFYGWAHEIMLGMSIRDISILTDSELEAEKQQATKQKRNHLFSKHRLADGAIRDVVVYSGPLNFQNRDLLYSIVYDITDHKQLEIELNKSRKLESIGVLAGGIAHDFNNLLTAIQGYIELSRMIVNPEHKAQKKLAAAQIAVSQATDLTNQLITFSKGGTPIYNACDIVKVIKSRLEKMQLPASIQTQIDADDDLWTIEIDKGQINQVIANITENALEAMPDGGTIHIRLENVHVARQDVMPIAEGEYVRITISDTGTGIKKKDMPHIFDPYYSTKQRGKQKGMGLGLAVCHSIVNRHKGCIRASSKSGQGATFQIHIPRHPLGDPFEPTKVQNIDSSTDRKIKVLLMDDEASVRDMTSELLETLGYKVIAAADGLEAIERYTKALGEDNSFDMLLLDLTVKGGLGGVLTLQRILEINPNAKAIVFSGYTDDPVIKNYHDYGFCDAITKPFTGDTLKTAIEKHR